MPNRKIITKLLKTIEVLEIAGEPTRVAQKLAYIRCAEGLQKIGISVPESLRLTDEAMLQIQASSSAGTSATLTVYNTASNAVIGTLPSTGKGKFRVSSNPGNITVKSSLGGSASANATVRP